MPLRQAESYNSITPGVNGNIIIIGTAIGNVTAGAVATYTGIVITPPGNYRLDARVSNGDGESKQFRLTINGQQRVFTCPPTGSWGNWVTLSSSQTVSLPIGTYTLTMEMISSHCDMDWFDIVFISPPSSDGGYYPPINPPPPGNNIYGTLDISPPVDTEYQNELRLIETQYNGGVRDRYLLSVINPVKRSFKMSVLIKNGQEIHKFLKQNRVFYIQGHTGLYKRRGYSLSVFNNTWWKLDLEVVEK